jgi:hypothetical protein
MRTPFLPVLLSFFLSACAADRAATDTSRPAPITQTQEVAIQPNVLDEAVQEVPNNDPTTDYKRSAVSQLLAAPIVSDYEREEDSPVQDTESDSFTQTLPQGIATLPSTQNYSGSCACPNDLDSAGNRCGARSAASRSGGYSAVCTPTQSYAYKPARLAFYGGGTTHVRGYFRKNGTYVRPYTRRRR